MPPDCGVPCPSECDIIEQDCPEGEKCGARPEVPGGCELAANLCVPAEGTRQIGEFCTRSGNSDDCGAGLFCLRNDSCTGQEGPGACVAICKPDLSCEGFGIENVECSAGSDPVLAVCIGDCNPVMPACSAGHGCYDALPAWRFACMETLLDGPGNDGAACDRVQGCQPGLICQPSASLADCTADYCCTPVCDAGGPGVECVTQGETCVPYFEMAPPGLENVGRCGLAQ